jgi:glycosyltransferase involved in cell wall biosynthesis
LTAGIPDVVWMAPTPWTGVPGTDRPLAMALTRYARILWVDPPASLATVARPGSVVDGGVRPTLSEVSDGITRLTTAALPGFTRPGVRATTAPLVRAQVRWALRKLGIRPYAVVAGYLEDYLGYWGATVNVLNSTDDHVAGAELMGLSASRIQEQERRAVARADVLAVVSPQLAEHWAALGARPVVIPNGCYPAYTSGQAPEPVPVDLPRPIVGLAGHLTERIDLSLLTAVADAGYSLLLVGPYDARWEPDGFAALIARPNVRYAGRVPAEEVPAYLGAMDIGLTPYGDSPFNYASFPMKTLEYFSAGLPVACTDLPGSRWLWDDLNRSDPGAAAGLMVLTSDHAEFLAGIRRLVGEPASQDAGRALPAALAARAQAFAERHSWPRRADALAAAMGLTAPSRQADDARVG